MGYVQFCGQSYLADSDSISICMCPRKEVHSLINLAHCFILTSKMIACCSIASGTSNFWSSRQILLEAEHTHKREIVFCLFIIMNSLIHVTSAFHVLAPPFHQLPTMKDIILAQYWSIKGLFPKHISGNCNISAFCILYYSNRNKAQYNLVNIIKLWSKLIFTSSIPWHISTLTQIF